MRRLSLVIMAICATSLLVGCVMPGFAPVSALIEVDLKGPLMLGDTEVGCDKVGTAEATGILFFSNGDASIKAAMEDAGITKIHHVDTDMMSTRPWHSSGGLG